MRKTGIPAFRGSVRPPRHGSSTSTARSRTSRRPYWGTTATWRCCSRIWRRSGPTRPCSAMWTSSSGTAPPLRSRRTSSGWGMRVCWSAASRPRSRDPAGVVALRRELGDLGRAVPVHQGRGRRGRAARIHRLGTGHARRRPAPALRPAARRAPRSVGPRLLGLVIGLGGVVALLGIDVAGRREELLGAALVLVATLGYAAAPIIVSRRLADFDPLGPVAASLALSTVALLPAVFASPLHAIPASALWAIAALGVVCTALGLVVFFRLIAEAGPSRASVITYINPLVAVLLGGVVLHEHLGPTSIVGLVLILGGSWLSTGGRIPFNSENGK